MHGRRYLFLGFPRGPDFNASARKTFPSYPGEPTKPELDHPSDPGANPTEPHQKTTTDTVGAETKPSVSILPLFIKYQASLRDLKNHKDQPRFAYAQPKEIGFGKICKQSTIEPAQDPWGTEMLWREVQYNQGGVH